MTRRLLLVLSIAASLAACKKDRASPSETSKQPPAPVTAPGQYQIAVTDKGFEPENLPVPQGKAVTLVFTRKTDNTCIKEVILQVADQKIDKQLPLNQPVEVAVTFPQAGKLTYACGMDMLKGTIEVK